MLQASARNGFPTSSIIFILTCKPSWTACGLTAVKQAAASAKIEDLSDQKEVSIVFERLSNTQEQPRATAPQERVVAGV